MIQLAGAFRQHFRNGLANAQWEVDPNVWKKDWGVHIQPFGSGANAIKYLGRYVARIAIADSRIFHVDNDHVTFRYKDRERNTWRNETIQGVDFVARYLRHVLPKGMHSVRYFGYCHPARKALREKIAFYTGIPLIVGAPPTSDTEALGVPECPCCKKPMELVFAFDRHDRLTQSLVLKPP